MEEVVNSGWRIGMHMQARVWVRQREGITTAVEVRRLVMSTGWIKVEGTKAHGKWIDRHHVGEDNSHRG